MASLRIYCIIVCTRQSILGLIPTRRTCLFYVTCLSHRQLMTQCQRKLSLVIYWSFLLVCFIPHPTMAFTLDEDRHLMNPMLTVSESASTSVDSTATVTTRVVLIARCALSILMSIHQGNIADGSEGFAERWISLSFTWSGRSFTFEVAQSDRLYSP